MSFNVTAIVIGQQTRKNKILYSSQENVLYQMDEVHLRIVSTHSPDRLRHFYRLHTNM